MTTWIGSPNYNSGRAGNHVEYISLHIMAGYLAGTDATFSRSSSRSSSTYGVGSDGSTHQYVSESNTAWADGSTLSNRRSISIEHAGGLAQIEVTAAEIEASAQLCADIARRYGWNYLAHGVNVLLHREIPPYTHPACPDICPNPLPWQAIINRANDLIGNPTSVSTTSATQYGGNDMALAYAAPEAFKGMKYTDGIHPPVGIADPSELAVMQKVVLATTGKPLQLMTFGGAEAVRFESLLNRSTQNEPSTKAIAALKTEVDAIKKSLEETK